MRLINNQTHPSFLLTALIFFFDLLSRIPLSYTLIITIAVFTMTIIGTTLEIPFYLFLISSQSINTSPEVIHLDEQNIANFGLSLVVTLSLFLTVLSRLFKFEVKF